MNEQRIREIANQASDHAENTVEYFPDTEDGLDYPAKMMKVRDLKFAQLIVRACAQIGELKEQGHEDYDPDMSVGWYMRQHFGIPE
jgi:hypothetical protein